MMWAGKDIMPPPNALAIVENCANLNNVELDSDTIRHIVALSLEYRSVYAQFYDQGRGLQRDGTEIRLGDIDQFVIDPYHLKPKLSNPNGGAFTPHELVFLIATKVLCNSVVAARTLGSLVTKRNRDKVIKRLKGIKWD